MLQVGSVLFAPSHVLALLTIGHTCGLVMDVGYRETLVIPVSLCYFTQPCVVSHSIYALEVY